VVAVLVVSVVIALATTSPSSGSGCLHLTVAGPVGAGEINECGVAARNTCADVLKPGAFVPAARGEVVAACRKARLPVG